ncbi:MAG: hypothetical protein D6772_04900 [Bacteroidetes bacterium]|nr:MAG: hypothetical protein D6772_04900 [Bacteroidota bacterium]
MNKSLLTSTWLIPIMILLAAATRVLPHWPNFTAVGAMALFGAATLRQRWQAVLVPFAALYLSDLVINNVLYAGYYDHFTWQISPFVYLAFGVVLEVGFWLRRRISTGRVIGASILTSILFFLTTNAGSWWIDPMYTKDVTGLLAAYTAGIPFFCSTLAGDLFYCAVLFGAYAWASHNGYVRSAQWEKIPEQS